MTSGANVVPEVPSLDPPKSMVWKANTAVVSGDAWISISHGLRNGRIAPSAYFAGALVHLGCSEFADYPAMSAAWNVSDPIFRRAGNVTMGRLSASADSAAEGVMSSAKFTIWWISGLVVAVFGTWGLMIWISEYLMKRTRSVGRQNLPFDVIAEPLKVCVNPVTKENIEPAEPPMSGPTSGNVREEDIVQNQMSRRPDMALFDNNGMRKMSVRKRKEPGNLETDLVYGDSLTMSSGASVACKKARIEVSICKMHVGEYLERVNDIIFGQMGCLARGMMGRSV